jgi:glycerate kinase
MASVAGLPLVPTDKRNPLYTTTYGVGEIILDAIRSGCRHFIVGIGGSATNDGGIGMLQALGFDMLDESGAAIPFGAIGLKSLASIDDVHVLPELKECHFRIACDVKNPLCGQDGCSAVFAPQKGASAAEIVQMDEWLERYAKIAQAKYPRANPQTPGCGAAGGLGFAFCTFMDAALESGIDIVLDEINLEGHIAKADLVITGEGRLDRQTVMGKAPIGVARIAQRYNKPVIAFAGCVTREARVCNEHGIDAFFPILREPVTVQEAMETVTARRNMADTVEQVMRLILRCRKET